MNITNAQFTTNGSITALVDGVQMSIPADAGNRHYAAMLEQGIQIAAYVEPPITADQVRAERDSKLAATDWVAIKAVDASSDGLGIQVPQAWAAYRQALRDVTDQVGFPENVNWPVKPE